jgi:SWI/SNF-related matrix-associated actin-dependent regulator of chromatin subfamily A member 5
VSHTSHYKWQYQIDTTHGRQYHSILLLSMLTRCTRARLLIVANCRARYNEQCAARDFEVAEEQARKREEREAMDVTGPRSNRAHFGASSDEPARPKKELSAAEAERRRVKAEAKAQELAKSRAEQRAVENSINTQQSTIKVAIAQQAEARLQYLLKQSDIFSHFGVGKVQADKRKADEAALLLAGGSSEKAPADTKKRKKAADGSHRRTGDDGSDADSDANDEDEELKGNTATTFLTVQPSIIEFGKLRHYQLEGLNWMIRLNANGINGILADEMGLGKTLQSIAVLAYMYEHLGIRGPHIILVPKSTLSNWMNEIARWCPTLRAIRFHGTKDERARLVEEELRPGAKDSERDWDVLVTTYEVANMEKRALQKFAWRYLIIDEAHRLKNEASLFSQTVRSLNMQHRLLLTGTPLQNNLHEVCACVYIVYIYSMLVIAYQCLMWW